MVRKIGVILTLACALVAGAVLAAQQGDKAYWGVFVETQMSRNVGMPDMSEMMRNMPAEVLAQMPAEVRAMMAGGATKRIYTRLWSPGIAPRDARATVYPPAGAKLGEKLDLDLYRPRPATGRTDPDDEDETFQPPKGKFTIKEYWGSSPTVKPGQPRVTEVEWGTISPEQQAEIRSAMEDAESLEYRPDWTTGYWPGDDDQVVVEDGAKLEGTFRLETTYTGGTTVEVPATVNFLEGIEFSSPKLSEAPDLTEAMAFEWKRIAGVLGFEAQITGMVGQDTVIIWYSSEVEPEARGNDSFMQMAEVRALVEQRRFMPGDATEVTVPAGIFVDADMVMMNMTGYGTGAANDEGDPRARVQTKTTFNGMLGGKMMADATGGAGVPPGFDLNR